MAAYSEKGYVVPSSVSEMPAFIHRNETVLPAGLSLGLQELIANGGGGGDVHFHATAMDGPSIMRFVQSPEFARGLAEKEPKMTLSAKVGGLL